MSPEKGHGESPTVSEPHDGGVNALSFSVGGKQHLIAASYVHEVRLLSGLTPVPGTPPHLLGIVEVRGFFVPVFDLALHGGYRGTFPGHEPHLVVFGEKGPEMAVLADGAPEYVRVRPDVAEGVMRSGEATWLEGDMFLAEKRFFL